MADKEPAEEPVLFISGEQQINRGTADEASWYAYIRAPQELLASYKLVVIECYGLIENPLPPPLAPPCPTFDDLGERLSNPGVSIHGPNRCANGYLHPLKYRTAKRSRTSTLFTWLAEPGRVLVVLVPCETYVPEPEPYDWNGGAPLLLGVRTASEVRQHRSRHGVEGIPWEPPDGWPLYFVAPSFAALARHLTGKSLDVNVRQLLDVSSRLVDLPEPDYWSDKLDRIAAPILLHVDGQNPASSRLRTHVRPEATMSVQGVLAAGTYGGGRFAFLPIWRGEFEGDDRAASLSVLREATREFSRSAAANPDLASRAAPATAGSLPSKYRDPPDDWAIGGDLFGGMIGVPRIKWVPVSKAIEAIFGALLEANGEVVETHQLFERAKEWSGIANDGGVKGLIIDLRNKLQPYMPRSAIQNRRSTGRRDGGYRFVRPKQVQRPKSD